MMNKRQIKAQSAMEYLMTYGWAILIIAVVLAALFSLGVFNATAALGTACIADTGYYCGGITYSHATGLIALTIGQNTGQNWATANIIFVPQGTPMLAGASGIPNVFTVLTGAVTAGDVAAVESNWVSGEQITLNNPLAGTATSELSPNTGAPVTTNPVGYSVSGTIWAAYTTTVGGAVQYAHLASVTLKAS
jgi:hypothetical protein